MEELSSISAPPPPPSSVGVTCCSIEKKRCNRNMLLHHSIYQLSQINVLFTIQKVPRDYIENAPVIALFITKVTVEKITIAIVLMMC